MLQKYLPSDQHLAGWKYILCLVVLQHMSRRSSQFDFIVVNDCLIPSMYAIKHNSDVAPVL